MVHFLDLPSGWYQENHQLTIGEFYKIVKQNNHFPFLPNLPNDELHFRSE
jgi:hypothetical protein